MMRMLESAELQSCNSMDGHKFEEGALDNSKRSFEREYLVFGQPLIDEVMIQEVVDSLRSRWIGTGPKVSQLESAIAQYVGAEHAVALNSCTAGLHLSLIVAGVGPGDEVITTPYTFPASVNAIVHVGATPVFVDVGRSTQNILPDQISRVVTPQTRAILPVHMAGRPCDMDDIASLAREHELAVIEDAAHAIGAEFKGSRIGSISDFTCFSFYATKNITTAEGGMVTTGDAEAAERIRRLTLHGLSKGAWQRYSSEGPGHYVAVELGFKYNLTDVHAAIGLSQVHRIDAWLKRREEIWARYDEAFSDLPVQIPAEAEDDTVHARHLYTLLLDVERIGESRDWFRAQMHQRNIGTGVHFVAVHLHPYYRDRFGSRDYPNAEWLSERTVSLPLSPALTDQDVEDVIAAVRDTLG